MPRFDFYAAFSFDDYDGASRLIKVLTAEGKTCFTDSYICEEVLSRAETQGALDYSDGACYSAHEYGNWKPYVAYHYRNCEHSQCLAEETQAHNFIETTIEGTVYEVCIVCSYNRKK